MGESEHNIQAGIVMWARMQRLPSPLCLLHSIPNGGQRHIAVAKKMKAEGQLAGIPDLFLPHAAHVFHGLYIEVKTTKGVLSASQKTIHSLLERHGYAVEIVRSIEEGVKLLQWYCDNKPLPGEQP